MAKVLKYLIDFLKFIISVQLVNIQNIPLFHLEIKDSFLHEMINLNIETIGVFIAIIGGLIASKIISLNTECDDLKNRLELLDIEIKDIQKRLTEKKKENLEMYKREAYEEIIDMLLDNGVDNKMEVIDGIWNPFVDYDERKKFIEEIKSILKNKIEIINEVVNGKIEEETEFIKKCNIQANTLEYEILLYVFYKIGG